MEYKQQERLVEEIPAQICNRTCAVQRLHPQSLEVLELLTSKGTVAPFVRCGNGMEITLDANVSELEDRVGSRTSPVLKIQQVSENEYLAYTKSHVYRITFKENSGEKEKEVTKGSIAQRVAASIRSLFGQRQ